MKTYFWDSQKNENLKSQRNVSFEDVLYYIANDKLLAIIEHPNQEKYKNQKIYVVNVNNYAYLVPFVETESQIFLKTIIPSRKATKKYLEDSHGKSSE